MSFGLIVLDNRRVADFTKAEAIVRGMAAYGFYFDAVSRVAYDSSFEIVWAFKNAAARYDDLIVFCPKTMENTVKSYLSKLYENEFDASNILKADKRSVYLILFSEELKSRLKLVADTMIAKYATRYEKAYIKAVCLDGQIVAKALNKAKSAIKDRAGAEAISITAEENFADYSIEITFTQSAPKMLVDETYRNILSELKEYVYAVTDTPLNEQLYGLLKLRRMKLSVAESFTGGGIGKRLVSVSGISEVFIEALNTYSNLSKTKRLDVSELTLRQRGAVSAETASEMVRGLLATGLCDAAISTTGIAGPKSDNTQKPVGLAYIGVGIGDGVEVYKFNFTGDRQRITETAINQALFLAYKSIKNSGEFI